MNALWEGYNTLVIEFLSRVDKGQADDELERTITQLLEPCIRRHLSGDEPYFVQHGPYEFSTRRPPPAQPPQYDMAFVLTENSRVMWPMEAKVLRTERTISRYIRDVRKEFLTGRYAPFVKGGAMLGYLFSGSTVTALNNIERALGCSLSLFEGFDPNRHRVSVHNRSLSGSMLESGVFVCHHLMMKI